MHYSSYQEILKEEFKKKVAINPSFSMRAFAFRLDISPSRLSEILSYKQGLSLKMAKVISKKLALDPYRKKYFELLVESKHARSIAQRDIAIQNLNDFVKGMIKKLTDDQYELIAQWYYYAILELVKTEDIIHSPEWIGKRLGLDLKTTTVAIKRLRRLDMLGYSGGKFFAKDTNPFSFVSKVPSSALRLHHQQIIDMAKLSVKEQSINERELNSLTIAINDEDREEITKKIRAFFDDINKEYSYNNTPKTKVYALTNQFFELGQKL